MIKKITLFVGLLYGVYINAQIINEPPYILTVDELKEWTQNGPTADPILIADEPLAIRFENTETQLNPDLPNDMEIAYLPDGMNNLGNYGQEQSQFNLYNFTNWSYIDKLVWFGGTASQTVQLPSAPWVNAAHRNGVKVLGNVFFAPNQFGGSTATLNNFLEQDGDGNFLVVPIMVEIMQYYQFDGWFINEETNTNSTTAGLMQDFLRDLTTAVEAVGKEVMWYDAMLLNGSVNWQNRLSTSNSVFVQNDTDGDTSNGFEDRISSHIFINFFWSSMAFPNASRNRANTIGRSSFEVFTGVDVWPGRNQARFQTGGNNWMSLMHDDPTSPITSFGLFAPNCVFNNAEYSTFNTDPNDYANFYSEERHMFAGADRNPRIVDASGFRGYSNWVPAASTITEIPFETNFNTGHGLNRFEEGVLVNSASWHNMNEQDILPNWQFAFSENGLLSATWDFENAYNGGSSLHLQGSLNAGDPLDLLLYKTQLLVTGDTKIDIIYDQVTNDGTSLIVKVSFANESIDDARFFVNVNDDNGWSGITFFLDEFIGEEIDTIGLEFLSSDGTTNYDVNVGNIAQNTNDVQVYYTLHRDNPITLQINWSSAQELSYKMYSVEGKLVAQNSISKQEQSNYELFTNTITSGIYLLEISDGETQIVKKIHVK
ncbi:T9SS type A sorting domain-containing protein [uncultured Dokdonia sp.]|uniref:endo-beta-N-acetylglucosaminidase n=1 Tax=uncultured Dokdonia sp. TaxID=575653 RepID=UPI002614DA66|nr:T9SS type A sorting domain-containing protein [uncultured Dokdonia sp.]